jgi:RnfABCDGE-type electron transport complex B subunit
MVDTERLLAILPHTQCRQCGYAGCAPYAEALRAGEATPDACLPGGASLRHQLSGLLNLPDQVTPPEMLAPLPPPVLALIDEETCIGCAKCLDACPVDAIVGASHQLHAVLNAACTGCGLCLPPCPVDCITLVPGPLPVGGWPSAASRAATTIQQTAAVDCTACGACVPVCPEGLHPQALLVAVQTLALADAATGGVARCTECHACDEVCPSKIPLAAHFAHAKQTNIALAHSTELAAVAASRSAARVRRMATQSTQVSKLHLPELQAIVGVAAQQEVAAAVTRAHLAGNLRQPIAHS